MSTLRNKAMNARINRVQKTKWTKKEKWVRDTHLSDCGRYLIQPFVATGWKIAQAYELYDKVDKKGIGLYYRLRDAKDGCEEAKAVLRVLGGLK